MAYDYHTDFTSPTLLGTLGTSYVPTPSKIDVEELKEVLAALRAYKVTKATVGSYVLELAPDVPEPDEKTWNEQLKIAAEEAEQRGGLVDPSQVKFK